MTPLAASLPSSVKVGCYTYSIEIQDDAWVDEKEVVGFCDNIDKVIHVADVGCDGSILNTFLHELLHAIYYLMDIKELSKEEKVVTQTATGLLMLFRDNPQLITIFNLGESDVNPS